MITIKKQNEIEKMRAAGLIIKDALFLVCEHIRPGVTTASIDEIVEQFILSRGATPSFKNYNGYPKSTCISINDVVVHGIPSERRLEEGDIVSIDVGAFLQGYHSDAARTFAVGKISEERKKLIDVTNQCFFEGIKQAREGRTIGDISHAIQSYAESFGFGVVRSMVGHGIGKRLHEEPMVPNYGTAGMGPKLKAGYTLAIEPMITLGHFAVKIDDGDGWTCRTIDGKDCSHYENTILITNDEPEILTL